MYIPVILFLFFLKKKVNEAKKIYWSKIFIFFIFIGFTYWFLLSPVYRFGIIYFLCFNFIASIQFYKRKIFAQKIFTTLLILFFTFNFVKNFKRISQKNYINFGIDKVSNEYSIYNSSIDVKVITVFKPNTKANNQNGNGWQGRLCWEIPFLCSYNDISVNKRYGYLFVNKLNKLE